MILSIDFLHQNMELLKDHVTGSGIYFQIRTILGIKSGQIKTIF